MAAFLVSSIYLFDGFGSIKGASSCYEKKHQIAKQIKEPHSSSCFSSSIYIDSIVVSKPGFNNNEPKEREYLRYKKERKAGALFFSAAVLNDGR